MTLLSQLRSVVQRIAVLGGSGAPSQGLSTSATLCKYGRRWEFNRGPYTAPYSAKHAKRKEYGAAKLRFRRLDWGAYIRPLGARTKRQHMKSPLRLYQLEQHVFLNKDQTFQVDRMLGPDTKRKRYFPEDIYEKYNRTSFFRHSWIKHKNRENIRQLGSDLFMFARYKLALSKHKTRYNEVERRHYEPPNYHANVFGNRGVFGAEFVPTDKPAPYFERPPVRTNSLQTDDVWKQVQNWQRFRKRPVPLWSSLLKGRYKGF